MEKINRETGIILAIDAQNKEKIFEILDNTYSYVDALKIGFPSVLSCGIDVISDIKNNFSLPIIADFKLSDIPAINKIIAEKAFNYGADAVTVQGFIGPDALRLCMDNANRKGVFVITELTHADGATYTQLISEDVAQIARDLGATGIQAPGTRPERIKLLRNIVGDKLIIIACGIGTQGGEIGGAIKAGADFEIIGRSITDCKNPSKKIKTIAEILNKLIQ